MRSLGHSKLFDTCNLPPIHNQPVKDSYSQVIATHAFRVAMSYSVGIV